MTSYFDWASQRSRRDGSSWPLIEYVPPTDLWTEIVLEDPALKSDSGSAGTILALPRDRMRGVSEDGVLQPC